MVLYNNWMRKILIMKSNHKKLKLIKKNQIQSIKTYLEASQDQANLKCLNNLL